MKTFNVKWEIDIEAETPREAAYAARQIQLDPDSSADVFEVRWEIYSQQIDLSDRPWFRAPLSEEIETLDNAKDFLRALHTHTRQALPSGGLARKHHQQPHRRAHLHR